MRYLIYALAFTSLMMGGCKQPTQSTLASLDNFTGVAHRQNACTANPQGSYEHSEHPMARTIAFLGPISSQLDAPFRRQLLQAVVNIPKPIQSAFLKSGGKILVTDNASAMCSEMANEGQEHGSQVKGLEKSCLVYIGRDSDHEQILHLVLPPQIEAAQHNIMRLTGLFVGGLLPQRSESQTEAATAFVMGATAAFIRDSHLSGSFKVLEEDLGKSLAQSFSEIDHQTFSVRDLVSILKKRSSEEQAKFSLFSKRVFVESFDSFFCNSWAPTSKAALAKLAAGDYSQINRLYNTRAIMKVLYKNSYGFFNSKARGFIQTLVADRTKINAAKSQGFALSDPVQVDVNGDGYHNWLDKTINVTGTFGKSLLWDQSTKPIADAYGRYSNRVVDGWNDGKGVVGGYTSGVSKSYVEEVYEPTQVRTQAVFDRQIDGGATTEQAFRNTMAVELLRPTGATGAVESSALGNYRFDGSQYEDNFQRTSEFLMGSGGLVLTAATPLLAKPRGIVPEAPGVLPTAGEIASNKALLEGMGVAPEYAQKFAPAFEGGSQVTTIKKGTSLYRVGEGPGSWLTREPVIDPINNLALPIQSEKTAGQLQRLVTTRDLQMLDGGVAPQPGMVSPGNPKMGGVNQLYLPREAVKAGGLKTVPLQTLPEQALIPSTVVAGAGNSNTAGAGSKNSSSSNTNGPSSENSNNGPSGNNQNQFSGGSSNASTNSSGGSSGGATGEF